MCRVPRLGSPVTGELEGSRQPSPHQVQVRASSARKHASGSVINLFAGQQWRCRQREQTYRHRGWGRKERVG